MKTRRALRGRRGARFLQKSPLSIPFGTSRNQIGANRALRLPWSHRPRTGAPKVRPRFRHSGVPIGIDWPSRNLASVAHDVLKFNASQFEKLTAGETPDIWAVAVSMIYGFEEAARPTGGGL